MGTLFRVVGFVVGLALFYFSISQFGGFRAVASYFRLVGWGYLAVIFNSFIGVMLFARAWYLYLEDHHHLLSYPALLKLRICGEAVNFMTPLGFAAGDPVRLLLLRKYLGHSSHLRSVVIDRIMHLLAAYLFCLTGSLLLFFQPVIFPRWLTLTMLALYGFLFGSIGFLVVELLQGKGLSFVEYVISWLTPLKKFPKVIEFVNELRSDLSFYADKPKGPFVLSFFLHFAGRLLGGVEIALILYFIQGDPKWDFAFMLAAVTSLVAVLFGFIPGALGVLETVYAQFFMANGLSPEMGITVQLIRRLRIMFWIGVGVFVVDYHDIISHFRKKKT